MTYSRKILKRMEAHGGNPPMWFDHHEDYPNWENGSILNLMVAKKFLFLHFSAFSNKYFKYLFEEF